VKSLRVAYVVNVFPKLSETFIAHELAELRRRGIELRVFPLRPAVEELRHGFITEASLETLTCRDPARLESELDAFGPRLLHAHFATEPADAARQWSRRLGVPFTFTAHGYDIRRKPPPDFAARAAAARALVTVSEANRRHIVETFGVPERHIRVIPCGVDTDRFAPPSGVAAKSVAAPVLLCVARHAKVKNIGLLLEACALLRDRGVAFQCILIGDGVLRAELEARHAALNLQGRVRFAGAQEQERVRVAWQGADLAVLTSENEGMPVSLMEAAACGVPAVAPAVGGIPELVEDGVTGVLVRAGGATEFTDALQHLLEDPDQRARMGIAARRRAVEHFSLARQVDALLALWREVLG
jgi:glycosyltransferase involved in cell wall biosynthesis